jgi:pilus assembly protein TadC
MTETQFRKASLWATFLPPVILFLSAKSEIIPELLIFIFVRLYLCTIASIPFLYAFVFKEFYWGPLTKEKNPKTYNLYLVIGTVMILYFVLKTCIDLKDCLRP